MDTTTPAPLPNERCARCGGPFRCGINDAGPCACATIHLSEAVLARLRQRYHGCLCLDCLKDELSAEAGAEG
jgi:ribosomal protein L34E